MNTNEPICQCCASALKSELFPHGSEYVQLFIRSPEPSMDVPLYLCLRCIESARVSHSRGARTALIARATAVRWAQRDVRLARLRLTDMLVRAKGNLTGDEVKLIKFMEAAQNRARVQVHFAALREAGVDVDRLRTVFDDAEGCTPKRLRDAEYLLTGQVTPEESEESEEPEKP